MTKEGEDFLRSVPDACEFFAPSGERVDEGFLLPEFTNPDMAEDMIIWGTTCAQRSLRQLIYYICAL